MRSRDSNGANWPHNWNGAVKLAMLDVMALAQFAFQRLCGRAATSGKPVTRRRTRELRWRRQLGLMREELRIQDARMARVPPEKRPRYRPAERLAILELKGAHGWSLAQTAGRFHVTPATISSWLRRVDEEGPDALVQFPEPVNKYPQFVGHAVRRLKTLCPALGKRQIAETLARAGLHLGATTVGRMLRRKLQRPSLFAREPDATSRSVPPRRVAAKSPNHVWHVDLTCAPIAAGFWTTWIPFALPQCWPFCWWVAVVVDHYSRRAMSTGVFFKQPSSEQVRAFLGRTIHANGAAPKYIVCDRGSQFDCPGFRRWCKRRKIRPRYGAIGRHGSIAVIERFILTLKTCCTRKLPLTPLGKRSFQRELTLFARWYNGHRPHTTLSGRTPDEVFNRRFPANRRPRYEPRWRWPHGSPCAKPWAPARPSPGAPLKLEIAFHGGRRHLPIVTLRRAA
jgi:transposase InsO family protein